MVNINFNISNLTMYEIWDIFSDYLSPDLTLKSVQLGRLKATELLFSWWLGVGGASLGNGGGVKCPYPMRELPMDSECDSAERRCWFNLYSALRGRHNCAACPVTRQTDVSSAPIWTSRASASACGLDQRCCNSYKNSSEDEIANVNFIYDDIVHTLHTKKKQ